MSAVKADVRGLHYYRYRETEDSDFADSAIEALKKED
jgi:hypothetical protein